MKNESTKNFATEMFRKGSNVVELIFVERCERQADYDCSIRLRDYEILDMMLFAFLLGACSCIKDTASFLELHEAIDDVYENNQPKPFPYASNH